MTPLRLCSLAMLLAGFSVLPLRSDPAPALAASLVTETGGALVLHWPGEIGQQYQIEASPDLATWTTLPGEFTGTGGELTHVVRAADATATARQFWRVVAGAHVLYDFTAGDTLAPKNGWRFSDTNWSLRTIPGSNAIGLPFDFNGNPPGNYASSEMHFTPPTADEFWLKFRLHIPVNYAHRSDVRIETPDASIQGWQVGDRVQGVDGLSEGIVSEVDGTGFFLRNPAAWWANTVWVGTIRNLTRNTSATSTQRAAWSSNNKLLAMWADGYSSKGLGSTIVWEMWPAEVETPGATATASNLAVHYSPGGHTGAGPHLQSAPFITLPADGGRYIDILVRGRFSSQPGAKNGVIQTWLRKQGANAYTLLHDIRDADMDKRGSDTSSVLQPWQNGYLMGWSNSGYDQDSTFFVSLVEYFTMRPAELPAGP